jgi:hypothetical protein
MKLFFDSSSHGLSNGQSVKAEVVAKESGSSLVIINGSPQKIDGELAVGQEVSGKIVVSSDGRVSLEISSATEGKTDYSKILSQLGLSDNAENRELMAAFSRFGLPFDRSLLSKASNLAGQLGFSKGLGDAIAFSILKGLPENKIGLVLKYFEGKIRFSELFSKLNVSVSNEFKQAWGQGEILKKALELISAKTIGDQKFEGLKQEFAEKLSENFEFQSILSDSNEKNSENKIYFQWPLFWDNSNLPDTLEGEAFYPPEKQKAEQGFSIRIRITPPNLGGMEISLNKIRSSVWAHFAVESAESEKAVRGIFLQIRQALKNFGWDEVKVSSGKLVKSAGFFSKSEEQLQKKARHLLDLKA